MPVTVIKTLPKPWKVGGEDVTEIEVREPLLDDILEAEKEANPAISPNGFNVQIACRTLVRAGTFTGPFVASQFKAMGARQWQVVREAMQEAELLGEG
jgi:phage FluMu protein gp41